MMKKVMGIFVLLLSLNAQAGTENLNSNLLMTFDQKVSLLHSKKPLSLIYVGQDISHPLLAIANESLWAGSGRMNVG